MKKVAMGVALAATVGITAIGGEAISSKAIASTFDVSSGGSTLANGAVSFSFDANDQERYADFQYKEFEQQGFGGFFSTQITDDRAQISTSPALMGRGPLGETTYYDITVFNPFYRYEIKYDDGKTSAGQGYSFNFKLYAYSFSPGSNVYETSSTETLLASSYTDSAGNTIVNGTPISTLPLPSSAPLFGVAILALGGMTYARRRAPSTT